MGRLNGKGGPRSWEIVGMYVDVLGSAEISGNAPLRKLEAPYGQVTLIDAEELIVERVFVANYPSPNTEALRSAKQLLAVALEQKN